MLNFVFGYLKFCFYKLKGFSASSASFTATLHEYDCDHKNFYSQFTWPISPQNSRTTYFFLLNWSYFSLLYEIQNHYFFKFYSEHNITNCIRRLLVILRIKRVDIERKFTFLAPEVPFLYDVTSLQKKTSSIQSFVRNFFRVLKFLSSVKGLDPQINITTFVSVVINPVFKYGPILQNLKHSKARENCNWFVSSEKLLNLRQKSACFVKPRIYAFLDWFFCTRILWFVRSKAFIHRNEVKSAVIWLFYTIKKIISFLN